MTSRRSARNYIEEYKIITDLCIIRLHVQNTPTKCTYYNTEKLGYKATYIPWWVRGAVWLGWGEGAGLASAFLSREKERRYLSSPQQSTSTPRQSHAWTVSCTREGSKRVNLFWQCKAWESHNVSLAALCTCKVLYSLRHMLHVCVCVGSWCEDIQGTPGQVGWWEATANTQWPRKWTLHWSLWQAAGWLSREGGDPYLGERDKLISEWERSLCKCTLSGDKESCGPKHGWDDHISWTCTKHKVS